MRIIAGKYRGKKLLCQQGENTRPTTDRVKEAMFGRIQFDIQDAKVLDMFAGTGALGIEAISRGAASCDFVENNREAIGMLKENLAGIAPCYTIHENDYLVALKALLNTQYDLIFIDPPYQSGFYATVLAYIEKNDMLKNNGTIVVETQTGMDIDNDYYQLQKEKKYGKTTLRYYKKGS
jgi:16S rRNA (guanine966-N2)-methyltransferase